jgi:hypothetical protein
VTAPPDAGSERGLTTFTMKGGIPAVATREVGSVISASERAFDGRVAHDDHALERAKEKLADLDRDLGAELGQIGPALTFDERLAYIRRSRARPEYRDAERAFVVAQRSLAHDLGGEAGGSMEAVADAGDHEATKQLLASYRDLAQSGKGGARAAIEWAHTTLHDRRFHHHAEVHAILVTAEHTFGEGVMAEIRRMIESPGHATFRDRLVEAADYFEMQMMALRAVKIGNLPHLLLQFKLEVKSELSAKETRRLLTALHREDPMVQNLARRFFAMAVLGKDHVVTGAEMHGLELLQDSARDLLEALRGAKHANQVAAQLRRFARVAGRATGLVSVLGVYISGKATIADVEQAIHSPNVTDIARTVSDFLQATGSGLELAPPPVDLIGTALVSIGAAIGVITLLWQGPSKAQRDEREVLGEMHFNHNEIAAFTGGYRHNDQIDDSSGHNLQRARELGLSARQIQHLAGLMPDVFSREGWLQRVANLHRFLREPAQGGLRVTHFPAFLELCTQPHHVTKFATLITMLHDFDDVPFGPMLQGLDVLIRSWTTLGHTHFAHLPDDQYRKWASVSEVEWKHILGR